MTEQTRLSAPLELLRGVIGREPGADEAFVLEFGSVRRRRIHMLGVRRPLDVEWWAGDELVRQERLQPWLGTAAARCDHVIERGVSPT